MFTFEITPAEGPTVATVESLPNQKAAWCYVEFLATQLKTKTGARIRVRNADGEIIIQAGAPTAVASIAWCHDLSCPLKRPRGDD